MTNRYKNAAKHTRVAPGGEKPVPPAEEPTPVVEEVTEPAPVQTTDTSDTAPMVGKEFLSKFVEPKSEGKSYSVYLSAEAGKKLEKLAKQLKCSKSKALDILLRNAVE
jgi:hypothetical protein